MIGGRKRRRDDAGPEARSDKRGYLKEDFRLFHLKDSRAQKLDYHYHEFDKLILLLGGKVTYVVEGVTYFLQPWDLLLVRHNLIHRPIIDPAEPYERVVIWLGREWLERRSDPGEALDTCFDTARERGFHLLRFDAERRLHYMQRIQQLEEALRDRSFGAARMADTLCQQLLIDVNRDVLRCPHRPGGAGQLPGGPQDGGGAAVHPGPSGGGADGGVPGQAVLSSAGTI